MSHGVGSDRKTSDLYNAHKGERVMMKEIKNPRAMTIEFRPEVADALRNLCSKTGITLTRAVNNAVEAYMPVIQKLAETLNDASVASENLANIGTNVDLNELYDSLFRGCFEITHNENDFVPTNMFRKIITNVIEESDVYRKAGLKYDSRFLDFLKRRYGLVATQPRKHSRKRGYVGILHGEWF